MKPLIKSILIFCVLFTGIFVYLNQVFKSEEYYNNTYNKFEETAENSNIDILIFGSSHAFTAYNPILIDNKTKATSFNMGAGALRLQFTDILLKEALKKTNPKVVVVEVFWQSVLPPKSNEDKGFQLKMLDNISNYNLDKLSAIIKYYEPNEYLSTLFPLIRNHDSWREKEFLNLNREKIIHPRGPYFYNGYYGHRGSLKKKDSVKFIGFDKIEKTSNANKKDITSGMRKKFNAIVKIAQDAGSQVLFVSSPDLRIPYMDYGFYSELEKLTTELNIDLINYNDLIGPLKIDLSDFSDPSHLNIKGGIKVSNFLATYINQNYVLPDRSNEKHWKEKDSLYKEFEYEFLQSNSVFNSSIKKLLVEDIKIDSLRILKKGKTYFFKVILDTSLPYYNKMDMFNLLAKIHPSKNNTQFVSKRNRDKGWEFDKTDILFNSKTNVIEFSIKSDIRMVDEIEFVLYKKSGYDGVIGNKISVENIKFKKVGDETYVE